MTVAEGYAEEPIERKVEISDSILSASKPGASSIITLCLNHKTVAVSDHPREQSVFTVVQLRL